jgi:hypothetical protein
MTEAHLPVTSEELAELAAATVDTSAEGELSDEGGVAVRSLGAIHGLTAAVYHVAIQLALARESNEAMDLRVAELEKKVG